MKKRFVPVFILTIIGLVLTAINVVPVQASKGLDEVLGKIDPPRPVLGMGFGGQGLSGFLTNILDLIYVVSFVVFIFMLVYGAFQWITSGGDKEAIAKARARITQAFIGVFFLAIIFVLLNVFSSVTGFNFFNATRPPTGGTSTTPLGPGGPDPLMVP